MKRITAVEERVLSLELKRNNEKISIDDLFYLYRHQRDAINALLDYLNVTIEDVEAHKEVKPNE